MFRRSFAGTSAAFLLIGSWMPISARAEAATEADSARAKVTLSEPASAAESPASTRRIS